jgi:hypothetical protein
MIILRCNWVAYGQFSPSGCTYCDNGHRKRTLKSIQKCSCIGYDSFSDSYRGTQEQCQSYYQSQANSFINNQVSFTYVPDGQFSKGASKYCGYKDLCIVF